MSIVRASWQLCACAVSSARSATHFAERLGSLWPSANLRLSAIIHTSWSAEASTGPGERAVCAACGSPWDASLRVSVDFTVIFSFLSFPVPSVSRESPRPSRAFWSRVRAVHSHYPSSLGLFRTSHDTSARPSQFCCLLYIVHELKGSVSHTACDLSCARIMQAARVAPVPLLTSLCDATHSPWSHG